MIDNSIEKTFFKYREALNYLLGKFNALADYYEIYTKDNSINELKTLSWNLYNSNESLNNEEVWFFRFRKNQ